jgi:OFA family oxalate/formate antiporter-like MFS transporter
MLTAWSFAGVLGPMLIAALREQTGQYGSALYVISVLMFASTAIPLLLGRAGTVTPAVVPVKTT